MQEIRLTKTCSALCFWGPNHDEPCPWPAEHESGGHALCWVHWHTVCTGQATLKEVLAGKRRTSLIPTFAELEAMAANG